MQFDEVLTTWKEFFEREGIAGVSSNEAHHILWRRDNTDTDATFEL